MPPELNLSNAGIFSTKSLLLPNKISTHAHHRSLFIPYLKTPKSKLPGCILTIHVCSSDKKDKTTRVFLTNHQKIYYHK